MSKLKIVSYNVNGTFNRSNIDHIVKLYQETKFDVLCIQEVKLWPDQLEGPVEMLESVTGRKFGIQDNLGGPYSGVAIIYDKSAYPLGIIEMVAGFTEHKLDKFRVISTYSRDLNLMICNVYVPNAGIGLINLKYKSEWIEGLSEFLRRLEYFETANVVICGDLNVVFHEDYLARPKSNWNKTAGFTKAEQDMFSKFMSECGLSYVSNIPEYTFWSNRRPSNFENNVGWRLDYFLTNPKIAEKLSDYKVYRELKGNSDHCPISITLNL